MNCPAKYFSRVRFAVLMHTPLRLHKVLKTKGVALSASGCVLLFAGRADEDH